MAPRGRERVQPRPRGAGGERRGELDGARERAFEPSLGDLASRREAEPAAGDGDADADADIVIGVDALDGAAAHAQSFGASVDPAGLGVVAARGGLRDEFRQQVEWGQPVAPVDPVAPVEPIAPFAIVAPVVPVEPVGGVMASRSTMKIERRVLRDRRPARRRRRRARAG